MLKKCYKCKLNYNEKEMKDLILNIEYTETKEVFDGYGSNTGKTVGGALLGGLLFGGAGAVAGAIAGSSGDKRKYKTITKDKTKNEYHKLCIKCDNEIAKDKLQVEIGILKAEVSELEYKIQVNEYKWEEYDRQVKDYNKKVAKEQKEINEYNQEITIKRKLNENKNRILTIIFNILYIINILLIIFGYWLGTTGFITVILLIFLLIAIHLIIRSCLKGEMLTYIDNYNPPKKPEKLKNKDYIEDSIKSINKLLKQKEKQLKEGK